jgi:AraC-like DNA-binding protein
MGRRRGSTERGGGVRSRCFAFGLTSHDLAVTVAWGTFDEEEARALGATWRATFDGPPRDTLVDVTHLTRSDAGAFNAIRDLLERHRYDRARVVRRQAIVAHDDYGGSFVRGYLAMFPPPYPLRSFTERDRALAWLDHPCCRDEVIDLERAREDVLARLRQWLDGTRLEDATLERAVAELGVTMRTLQRRLSAAGTRFVTELARAQVSRAQLLMRDPDRKLSDVAREVGCSTPSTFSVLFRRVAGETPSRWRRRCGR